MIFVYAIMFLAFIGWLIGALWEGLVDGPLRERALEDAKASKEKAAKDYYASLDAMSLEEHRVELAKVEMELRAEVAEYAASCRLWDADQEFLEYLIGDEFIHHVDNLFGWPWSIPFEQWTVNRYRSHLSHIIQRESNCDGVVAWPAVQKVFNAKIVKWVMEAIAPRKAEEALKWKAFAVKAELADFIASQY